MGADAVAATVLGAVQRCINAARFNQLLAVSCRVAQLKRASMVFTQEIVDEQNRIIVSAEVTIACVRVSVMKPIAIPEDVSGVIARATS